MLILYLISQTTIFYEDFESTTFPPSGWQNTGTRNTKWVRRTSGVVFGSGSAGVQVAQTASETGTAILQTPLINLPSISPSDSIIFSFYYRLPSVGGSFDTRFKSSDTIKVQISNDGDNWNDLIVWDSTSLYTGADNQRKKVQFDISSYQNSSIYIRWIFIDNTSSTDANPSYFNIDSIFIGVKAVSNNEKISNKIYYNLNNKLLFNTKNPVSLKIYNLSGYKVLEKAIPSGNSKVDISSIPNGIYILRVYENNKVIISDKIIKK